MIKQPDFGFEVLTPYIFQSEKNQGSKTLKALEGNYMGTLQMGAPTFCTVQAPTSLNPPLLSGEAFDTQFEKAALSLPPLWPTGQNQKKSTKMDNSPLAMPTNKIGYKQQ